jgi:hypothetical protein
MPHLAGAHWAGLAAHSENRGGTRHGDVSGRWSGRRASSGVGQPVARGRSRGCSRNFRPLEEVLAGGGTVKRSRGVEQSMVQH